MKAPDAPDAGAQDSQQQLQELLQFVYMMPVAILQLGAQGAVQMLNPMAAQLLQRMGINPAALQGPEILEALSSGLSAVWAASAAIIGPISEPLHRSYVLQGAPTVHLVLRLIRPDPHCTMISMEDVSATVEQERLLYQHRQWLGLVLEQIEGYCVAMVNNEGRLLAPNPSIDRMFGANSAQLVDQCLLGALAPAQSGVDLISFSSIKRALLERSSTRREIALRHQSGRIIWGDVLVARTLRQDQTISGYVMFIRDASIQHAAQQELIKDAQTDPLTGLFNRRGLESNMHGQPERPNGSVSVASWIMMDIDHFKDINDSYGHAAGDDVLRQVANVLKNSAREGDIVARVGGEEFLIMLPGVSLATALAASERLRRQIENSEMVFGLRRVRVTASFGVAEQVCSERWVETVAMADEALLIAKTSGRNRCVTAGNSS